MPSTSVASKLAAHSRWHRDKGVQNPDCEHCLKINPSLAQEPIAPVVAHPESGLNLAEPEQPRLSTFVDRARLITRVATGFTLSEVAAAFSMTEEKTRTEIQNAYGCTWEEFVVMAPPLVAKQVLQAIWHKALSGDQRMILLLERAKQLPGFKELESSIAPGLGSDLRKMSTEQLEQKRLELCRVLDRPKGFNYTQTSTMELRDPTDEELLSFPKPAMHTPVTLDYDGHEVRA